MRLTIAKILDALGIANLAVLVSLEGWESILSIISTIIIILSMAISLVFKIVDKVKTAKEDDGKVSIDELKEIVNDTSKDAQEIVDKITDLTNEIKDYDKTTEKK